MSVVRSLPDRPLEQREVRALENSNRVAYTLVLEKCPCCDRVMTFEVVAGEWAAVCRFVEDSWKSTKRRF